MTARTTKEGGTDWSCGEVLQADDLNDTFDSSSVLYDLSNQETGDYWYEAFFSDGRTLVDYGIVIQAEDAGDIWYANNNLAKDITPTNSNWTSPENAYDENTSTAANRNLGGNGTAGLFFDLGSQKDVMVFALFGGNTTNNGFFQIEGSNNGTAYTIVSGPVTVTNQIRITMGSGDYRYWKFYFENDSGSAQNCSFYEGMIMENYKKETFTAGKCKRFKSVTNGSAVTLLVCNDEDNKVNTANRTDILSNYDDTVNV